MVKWMTIKLNLPLPTGFYDADTIDAVKVKLIFLEVWIYEAIIEGRKVINQNGNNNIFMNRFKGGFGRNLPNKLILSTFFSLTLS